MKGKFWRRTAAACLAVLMVSGVIPLKPIAELADSMVITASADELPHGTCGDNLTWGIDEEGTLTISGKGAMYGFDSCETPWYEYHSDIRNVVIENGVTSIGEYAFYYCCNLTEITIPEGVTIIKEDTFSECERLVKVTLPASLTSIESCAFDDCGSLKTVIMKGEVPPQIDYYIFGENHNDDVVFYVPEKSLNKYLRAWRNYALTVFSSKIEEWDCGANGDNCKAVLTADGTLTISGTGEMRNYNGNAPWDSYKSDIIRVVIENGVTSIGGYAFYGCSSLTAIIIPDGVTSIGGYAFYCCRILTAVTIPEGVTSIGEGAFSNCDKLSKLTIPDSVTSIGKFAFVGAYDLTEISIPYGVTSIGTATFSGCSSLTEIIIPDSVTSIGERAFIDCSNLKKVIVKGSEPADFGVRVFEQTSSELLIYVPDESVEQYKAVENLSFFAHKIRSYTIGEWDCGADGDNCKAVLTADGTLTISGTGAMRDYSVSETPWHSSRDMINGVVIEDGVESIGDNAFSDCNHLTAVTISESVTSIGESAFNTCTKLPSVTLPQGVKTIGQEAFFGCSSLAEITIPGSVTTIGMNAFDGCRSLTELTVPEGVVSIGKSAFAGCTKLTAITLPETLTFLGSRAFSLCENLKQISIPSGMTSIEDFTFEYCSGLTAVEIPETVNTIKENAFDSCSSLTEIIIPESVTGIGGFAFSGCRSLRSIIVKRAEPAELGVSAFLNTFGKLSIYVPEESVETYQAAENWSAYKENIESGTIKEWECGANGDNCKAVLTADGTLTISGTGSMRNYVNEPDWYGSRIPIKSVVIENGVTSIGNCAFFRCNSLTAITIPNSVTSIGQYAFYKCSSLYEITIPDNVTSIGLSAFKGCSSLTAVTIPDSVESIGSNAFYDCIHLTAITIPDGITSIENNTFLNCSSLTEITIPNSVTSIGEYAFDECSSLKEITIPDSVTSIGNYAFYGCSNLNTLTILNPECEIKDSANTIPTQTVIHGYTGSTAEAYAEKYGRSFISLDTITEQPADFTGKSGEIATFSVKANGTGISYQWEFKAGANWKPSGMTGNQTAVLSVPVTAARDGQEYRCVVKYTDNFSVISESAVLRVSPTITAQPTAQALPIGEIAEFTVEASGAGALSYQWQFKSGANWKDSDMDGAETPTMSVPVTAAKDGKQYRCIVSAANGTSEISEPVSITVKAAITAQPTVQTLELDQTAKFTVAATGINLTYQWQFKDGATWKDSGMTGAKTPTLNVPVTAARDGQQYRCIVKSSNGTSDISSPASIKVKTVITTQPTNQTGKIDSTVKFTVAASGTNLKYQWQFLSTSGWKNSGMTGANTATLSVPVTAARDGQQYKCVVTSANGTSATTNVVKLIAGVKITAQPKDYTGNINTNAKFTVAAVGNNLSYQWQFNDNGVWKDSGMTGAKTNTLSVPITAARNGQKYRCVVKSVNGTSEASSAATLKAVADITGQPQNVTAKVGETAKFIVTAANATYQWQFLSTSGWQNSGMTGAQTATISVPVTEARDGQKYRCVVKFADGTTQTSNEVSLKVQAAITAQPQNASGKVGETAKFTVAASGTNLTYQWQFYSSAGWQNSGMTGAKTATISVPITDARNGQQYRCIVTSGNGTTATSNAAKLTVTK